MWQSMGFPDVHHKGCGGILKHGPGMVAIPASGNLVSWVEIFGCSEWESLCEINQAGHPDLSESRCVHHGNLTFFLNNSHNRVIESLGLFNLLKLPVIAKVYDFLFASLLLKISTVWANDL